MKSARIAALPAAPTARGFSSDCQPLFDDANMFEVARLPGLAKRTVQRVATAASFGLQPPALPDRG